MKYRHSLSKMSTLLVGLTVLLAVGLSCPSPIAAQTPCCVITGIDEQTGVVAGKVNATGQDFQFKVTDVALLPSLKIGQKVYANFKTHQVSLNGKAVCCNIVTLGPAKASPLDGVRTPNAPIPTSAITATQLRTLTIARNASDPQGKTATVTFTSAAPQSELPNSLTAIVNGQTVACSAQGNGNFTGLYKLRATEFRTTQAFAMEGGKITKRLSVGAVEAEGPYIHCHTVTCPPGCKDAFGSPCVVCIECEFGWNSKFSPL